MTERSIPHIRDIFGEDVIESCTPCEEMPKEVRKSRKTEEEVKHLERHLSMKKTIRKKMMRDLQQALVGDPDEAKQGDLNALHFTTQKKKREEGFLDFLKTGGNKKDEDSGRGSPCKEDEKKGFWRRFTIKRNKR